MELKLVEAGTGPPVVLLHGLFGSARNFGSVQKQLAARYRVLATDLRNHGSSPHESGMSYDLQATDVLQTLRRYNAAPATLVGHSMGGKVAMYAALLSPESVARLAVCDIAPVAYPPQFHAYAQALQNLDLKPGLTRAAADEALAADISDPTLRAFLLQGLQLGASPHWRIGLAEIAAGLPEIAAWNPPPGSRFAGPTMFLTAERSAYVRSAHRPVIKALFPAAELVALRHAGHWLHADQPGAFLAVLGPFLERGAAEGSPPS